MLLSALLLCIAVIVLVLLYRREVGRRLQVEQSSAVRDLHLTQLLKEKEWLLSEINHRVKNNLQIMISLLNSQEFFLKDPEAREAIRNSQRRLQVMSLAYQKVYEPEHPSDIDMNLYISELVEYLRSEYKTDTNINFNLQIDKVFLPVTTAVPLGMIINEAFSNSLRYAFPRTVGGEIEIKFLCNEQDACFKLMISDNGVGLPQNFKQDEMQSLGTSLMLGLSKQLKGDLQFKNEDGLAVIVEFTNLKPETSEPLN
jgi:two-component sensor histidine kinase